jgi:hypothetical protein
MREEGKLTLAAVASNGYSEKVVVFCWPSSSKECKRKALKERAVAREVVEFESSSKKKKKPQRNLAP